MTKYKLIRTFTHTEDLEVEAETEADAWKIANDDYDNWSINDDLMLISEKIDYI